MLRLLALLVLAGCAAAPQDPCARECRHVYDSCMETGSRVTSARMLEQLAEQCEVGQSACVRSCQPE